jgi:two-component system, cell cycle sensor histidine kinase and response regulator CckA
MERTDFEQWKAREVARLLALVETERRYYQEMVATLPVALVVLSADRSIVSANRAFRQTFGVRSEDLRRKTIEQIIPSPHLIERIRDTHQQGVMQPDMYLDIDGRPLRIAILPIRNWDDEGELETLLMVEDLRTIAAMLPTIGHLAPVTAPAPIVDEIRKVEELEEPAVVQEPVASIAAPVPVSPIADTAMPAVLWRADAETFRFTLVYGSAEQLLGYPVSHWLEAEPFFSERIHPEDRTAMMAFYGAAISREGDASAEFRVVTATGGVRWCRETIRVPEPEVDSQHESRSITGVLTDITLRKQMEEQLLTAERHDALHTLTSRLMHDLNNPLMIITGYSEELLRTLPVHDAKRDDVEQILGATERISGITGQLLAFTRRLANPPQPVELGMLITAMELHLAREAGAEVPVELNGSQEPVWASADPVQLEEILLALVSSAREDAQERSRVTIGWEVDAIAEQLPEATLKPGLYARILIHDNGRGVDAAKRVTVFESVLAAKDPEKSAGPELARAYAIVREWGGDIAFASDPYRGSTFILYLPYALSEIPGATQVEIPPQPVEDSEPVAEVPAAVDSTPVPVEIPAEPMRETVLLVEDEPGIRALVRKILSRERYHVLEAASGEDALTVALSHASPIHLLLTDVMLPGIGGRDLAEGLRATMPELRVVYISGYTDDEALRTGWFPPGSMFLQKPFTLTALVSKVRDSLDTE